MGDTIPNDPRVAGDAIVTDPARPGSVSPGPKVPEFLADKLTPQEFAALPESARSILVEKAKAVQEDYRQKTTTLATQRKQVEGLLSIQEQLDADPKLQVHLTKAIQDYRAGKSGAPASLEDDWDKLKEESDAEGQRVLRTIERKFAHAPIMEKLEALSQQLSQVVSGTHQSRQATLEQELTQLPQEFTPLIEEHRAAILKLGTQPSFSGKSAQDLLGLQTFHSGQRHAYEQAVFAARTRTAADEVQRAREMGGFPSLAGAPETPTIQDDDFVESRDPRFGKSLKIGNLVGRVFGEVKRHLPEGAR